MWNNENSFAIANIFVYRAFRFFDGFARQTKFLREVQKMKENVRVLRDETFPELSGEAKQQLSREQRAPDHVF